MTSPVLPSEFLVKSLDDAMAIVRKCRWKVPRWTDAWNKLDDAELYLDKQASRILMEAGQ
jgi:hypothetical protein